MLTIYAPAKVNLILEVLGTCGRYHQISTIIQTVSLYDILKFELAEEISFVCDEPSLERGNLVPKAAEILRRARGYRGGVRIELIKHIPWGVGLGGGSSDAAAALLGLNKLWGLGLSISALAHLASRAGSDIPFFIYGGIALAQGRGEKIMPLPALPPAWFVLLVPPLAKIPEKTRQMYNKLNSSHFTRGQFVDTALPDLRQGKFDFSLTFNAFEGINFVVFPELRQYKRRLEEAGARRACLTGSGPCLFAILSEEKKAGELCSRLKGQGLECYLVSSCYPGDRKDAHPALPSS